jgi:hypothetical protein
MREERSKGLYGLYITTEMRLKLSYQAIYLLDFFQGIWRSPRARVKVSNGKLSTEFGWSVGTTKRALTLLEEKGYIRRTMTSEGQRVILPGGFIEQDQGCVADRSTEIHGSPEDTQWIKDDPQVDQERSLSGSSVIHIKPSKLKPSKLKQIHTPQESGERAVALKPIEVPPKKTLFDIKTSIPREGYQELLTRTDLANGDRAWLYSQMESMQDWSAESGNKKLNWLAAARNWLKRSRSRGDIPNGASPPRKVYRPKTFKQIDDEEFESALKGFMEHA